MVRSLAWRIQIWHALTLLTVVVGLGALVYFRIDRATFRQVDTELEGVGQRILGALAGLSEEEFDRGEFTPPPMLTGRHILPPADRPPPPERGRPHDRDPHDRPPPRDRRGPDGPPRDGPSRGGPGRDRPPPRDRRPRQEDEAPAFIVWYGDGRELYASANAPPMDFEEVPALVDAETAEVRGRRDYREAFMRGPRGSVVMVGRSIRREQGELNQWRWLLLGAGGGALAIGVVGGSWLTRRALRPLEKMSQAAAAISSTDWSARIDTARIDVELATLAHTLNDAFDRLEADFQKQARFTADASHELRTPLTVILGHLDLALTQGTPDPASRDAMNACLRAARRMKSLIEQLLLLARADAGKLTTQHVRLDFGATVEECIDLLRPMARDKQVVLQATVKPVDVIGDPSLLAQVAINLITNAIQHNEAGGTVNVTVSSDKQSVRLVVADTGLGISEAAQARLFERFYRADAARSRATGGAGLGLAITQSIVRAHGGEITCTSRAGQGSEFVVTLPSNLL